MEAMARQSAALRAKRLARMEAEFAKETGLVSMTKDRLLCASEPAACHNASAVIATCTPDLCCRRMPEA